MAVDFDGMRGRPGEQHLRSGFADGNRVVTILHCSGTVEQRRLDTGERIGAIRNVSKIE